MLPQEEISRKTAHAPPSDVNSSHFQANSPWCPLAAAVPSRSPQPSPPQAPTNTNHRTVPPSTQLMRIERQPDTSSSLHHSSSHAMASLQLPLSIYHQPQSPSHCSPRATTDRPLCPHLAKSGIIDLDGRRTSIEHRLGLNLP
jgi:hypothetical protein